MFSKIRVPNEVSLRDRVKSARQVRRSLMRWRFCIEGCGFYPHEFGSPTASQKSAGGPRRHSGPASQLVRRWNPLWGHRTECSFATVSSVTAGPRICYILQDRESAHCEQHRNSLSSKHIASYGSHAVFGHCIPVGRPGGKLQLGPVWTQCCAETVDIGVMARARNLVRLRATACLTPIRSRLW